MEPVVFHSLSKWRQLVSTTRLRELLTRAWWTFRPGRRDADLEQELRAHAELAQEAGAACGRPVHAMDALRDQRGLPWLADLLRDLRYGARVLNRQRLFAAVAVLTLAVGIGATTAVFSVVDAVLLRPLPYPHPERLVALRHAAPGAAGIADVSGDFRLSASMYFSYADHNRVFERVGIWSAGTSTVTGAGEPEEVREVDVTHGTLDALGVAPLLGRWLSPADMSPGNPPVVMLGYGYWQRRFGGDRSVVGRTLRIDGRPTEVVGVMPAGFRIVDTDADVIAPLPFDRQKLILPGFGFQGIARLKPGVTIAAADADLARILPIWERSWPSPAGVDPTVFESFRITPMLQPLHAQVVGTVGSVLWILMGTIGIVLLVACANVASLLLVRTEARQQELAVRASLGAGRGRIVRGLLLESLLLAVISGAGGVALAYGGLRALVAMSPANLPRLAEVALDGRALAFAFAISVLSGVLFGLLPALKHTAPGLANALRAGGRSSTDSRERHRTRNVLIVAQVAFALMLLVSSGLMLRTSLALRDVEPGFTDPASLQTVRLTIPQAVVAEPERVTRLQQDIAARLAALPGVTSVGFSSVMHMEGLGTPWDAVRQEGAPQTMDEIPPMRVFKFVSPRFFSTTGTRLVAGREYDWTDLYGRRFVVIVSENLAREFWGSAQAAVGRRLNAVLPGAPWFEVIGVVQDVRDNGIQLPAPAIVYWPALGPARYRADAPVEAARSVSFALRTTRAGSQALLAEMKQAIWAANGQLPLASVRTMQEAYDHSLARTSFTLIMLGVAAATALLLGVVGIYGAIAYAVTQRTREIGIRVALGAERGQLTAMFVRSGVGLCVGGIAVGLAAAAALSRLMGSLLYGVTPLDPVTFTGVPIVLLASALVASYVPARRAAAIDPAEALKPE
jgi:predicted permease